MVFVLDIIAKEIKQNFKDCYVLCEKVQQGYDENCFILLETNGETQKSLNNRYLGEFSYEIFYYSNKNLNKIGLKLCEILNSLDNGKYKAFKVNYKCDNNELKVFVTYKTFLFKANDDKPKMNNVRLAFRKDN